MNGIHLEAWCPDRLLTLKQYLITKCTEAIVHTTIFEEL